MKELATIVMIVAPWIMYFIEHQKRLKVEQDLAIVVKRKVLNDINKDVDDSRIALDAAIKELGDNINWEPGDPVPTIHTSFKDDLPSGEMQEAAPQSEPPKGYFKGIAAEDLREGQACYAEVDPSTGRTIITAARAEPVFEAAKAPPTES